MGALVSIAGGQGRDSVVDLSGFQVEIGALVLNSVVPPKKLVFHCHA